MYFHCPGKKWQGFQRNWKNSLNCCTLQLMENKNEKCDHATNTEEFRKLFDLYRRYVRDAQRAGVQCAPVATSQAEFNVRISQLEEWERMRFEEMLSQGFVKAIPASTAEAIATIQAIREGLPPPDVEHRVERYFQNRDDVTSPDET
jgi:hypothetical protein